eukprot:99324_1
MSSVKSNVASAAGSNVKVALRVRPLIDLELEKGDECVVKYHQHAYVPQIKIDNKCFPFDYLFKEKSQQKQVYVDCIKPLVTSFLEGYNATVIAYGQTGSGKTYTMGTLGLQEACGVIPSAIQDMFFALSRTKNDYKVKCSFIEIYNEEIKDLLDPHTSKQMDIWEVKGATRVQNMRFESVQSINQCANVLRRGGRARSTGSTRMNAKSSRSHAIFTVHLEKTVTEPMVIQSKFHFVDLAGSERVAKTGSSGTRFAEG